MSAIDDAIRAFHTYVNSLDMPADTRGQDAMDKAEKSLTTAVRRLKPGKGRLKLYRYIKNLHESIKS